METKRKQRNKKASGKASDRSKQLMIQAVLSVLVVVLLFGNSYAAVKIVHGQPVIWNDSFASVGTQAESGSESGAPGQAASGAASESAAAPVQEWNTLEAQEGPVNAGAAVAAISSMVSVPANGQLSMEYFRDALFIGDSVTEGFALYEPLKSIAKVYGIRNATAKTFLDNAAVIDHGHSKTEIPAIWDAISAEKPGKIYIMIGTNSIVSDPSDDALMHWYNQLLDKLMQTFPGIPIYVQGVTPVSKACAEKNSNYSLTRLHTLNNKIAQMAATKGLYYIDTHEALANDEGYLPDEITGWGGMHILPSGYFTWADYLRTHTVYSPSNLQFLEQGPYG